MISIHNKMLKLFHRSLFFSIPNLSHLPDSDRQSKLQELEALFQQRFTQDYQQKIRDSKSSFSSEQLEKLDLIHDQVLKMNTFEIITLKKSVQSSDQLSYDWPIFSRPSSASHTISKGQEVPGLGQVSSSFDLISKLSEHGVVKQVIEEEVKVEETTRVFEKSSYNLVLVSFDPSAKVKFIKAVKDILGLGLKESKEKVEEVAKGPVVLFKSVSKESHGKIHEALLAAGGQVEFQ
jgi:large subunit ribosomal protein L7/L12